ncbi:MAG: ABC transporter substrate-binding protein [Nocardioides sp.]|nr:ABC transporter substrate-binding protein [Nocardioides sp.]
MNLSRKATLAALTSAALVSLSACGGALGGGGDSESDDVLTIGLLIPKTGTYAPLGKEMQRAADLYIKKHDDEIDGQEVKLVVADSAGNPETAKSKAKEMILRDNVDVITGIVSSPEAVTVAQEAEANEVPLVIANAGANEVTGEGVSDYVWRVSQSNYDHGYAAGVYAATEIDTENGVFIGADYSAGTETRDGFIDGYQDNGGGDLAKEILTPFGKTQNYQPFLGQIPDDASFVYAFFAGGEAITFDKNWKEFGYDKKMPLIGAQNLTDEDILGAVGDSAVGITTVGLYSPALENEANKKFTAAWSDAYDATPSIIAVTTYDSFAFIDAGAEEADGDVTAQSLTDAFSSVGAIDSPRGEFTVDPETHNPVQSYYVRKLVKAGAGYSNKVIETIEPQDN